MHICYNLKLKFIYSLRCKDAVSSVGLAVQTDHLHALTMNSYTDKCAAALCSANCVLLLPHHLKYNPMKTEIFLSPDSTSLLNGG